MQTHRETYTKMASKQSERLTGKQTARKADEATNTHTSTQTSRKTVRQKHTHTYTQTKQTGQHRPGHTSIKSQKWVHAMHTYNHT